jgi:hypothetical protein
MEAREVRMTKKKKPYVVCDPCGIQLFIRGSAGIEGFTKLVERAGKDNLWTRLSKMEQTYHLKCPKMRWSLLGGARADPDEPLRWEL